VAPCRGKRNEDWSAEATPLWDAEKRIESGELQMFSGFPPQSKNFSAALRVLCVKARGQLDAVSSVFIRVHPWLIS